MPVSLYVDGNVNEAITDQLSRRGVDVLTVVEEGLRREQDEDLLERAYLLQRLIFTRDIGFKALAEDWQRQGRPFAGLAFGHQLGGTIGQFVSDLELIAKASDPQDWISKIEYLPFR